jgi:zinc transport system substrate-binding protein
VSEHGQARAGHVAMTTPLEVVATAYPIAMLVSYIGGKDVRVVDLVPPGTSPQSLSLTPAQRRLVRSAPLVIEVGDGYQPAVEATARSARRHLALLPALSRTARPYQFWLDPTLMGQAAVIVGGALSAADPVHRAQFGNGSEDFQSVTDSIESDLESTFSACGRQEFVTADDAFGRFATGYGLTDDAVSTLGVTKAAAAVQQAGLPAVFSEVGVRSGALDRVASLARVSIKSLDPMEVTPPADGPKPLSYFGVIEEDLTALEGPLACDTTDTY